MLKKEEIEIAKSDLSFFYEGDWITKEMSQSAEILQKYIEQLESEVKDVEKLKSDNWILQQKYKELERKYKNLLDRF